MDKDKAIRLCTIVFLVVAMRVARPFKNIQLFLFNSLRAVLGMGNENGLACYGFDKSSFGCCVEEIKRQVQELGLGLSE